MDNRITWKDEDWATYLGCPVKSVVKYRTKLNNMFLPCVEQNRDKGTYNFCLYKYNTAPSGHIRLQLLKSSTNPFDTKKAAITYANSVISRLELSDYVAHSLHIPPKAVQMLLIKAR